MKYKAMTGLVLLGLAGVAHAVTLEFSNDSGNQWSMVPNWDERGTDPVVPATALPTVNDGVSIAENQSVQIDAMNAVSKNLTMEEDSSATITANGTLAARIFTHRKNSTFTNNGTLNLELFYNLISLRSEVFNTGTIRVDGLKVKKNATFNMLAGTFVSSGGLHAAGSGGVLNLHGGTMTFTDVDWFDTGADYYGDYKIDIANDGILVITGANRVSYLQAAITDGYLTGATADEVTFDGSDTKVDIPEPSVTGMVLGLSALILVSTHRRLS